LSPDKKNTKVNNKKSDKPDTEKVE